MGLHNVANLEDMTPRTQLISPPPEETLHFRRTSRSTPLPASASKRKRNMPQPAEPTLDPPQPPEATPNPKPRKQSKHRPILAESPTRPSHRSPAPTTPSKPTRVLFTKSPHAENPDADFIPPIPTSTARRATLSARARRTTPIPAYEPPTDVFTPPRIVVLTPSISKSSKRKTSAKPKRTTEPLKIAVKKEAPHIDLSLPMPPPSPTDDPLLLSGSVELRSSPVRRTRHLRQVGVSTTPVQIHEPLPPSSSPADEDEPDVPRFDWNTHPQAEGSTDFSMDIDDAEPGVLFDFNLPGSNDVGGGWSDSDDDDDLPAAAEEGVGEYTGRFRTVRVRTKMDPPSSATRERMEEWGRPITPFPRKKISRLDLLKEVEGEDEENHDVEMIAGEDDEQEDEDEEREVREMSVHLDDEEEPEQSVELDQDPSASNLDHHFNFDASFDTPPIQGIPEPAEEVSIDIDPPTDASELPKDASDAAVLPLDDDEDNHGAEQSLDYAHDEVDEDEEEEEEREVREMSVIEDEDLPNHTTSAHRSATSTPAPILAHDVNLRPVQFPSIQPQPSTESAVHEDEQPAMERDLDQEGIEVEEEDTPAPGVASALDDEDASDSDSDIDFGMVKISSADPRAAARAAAILKQHDYDCFTKITMLQKQKQRKRHSLSSSGGITKTKTKAKNRRRTTLGASVVGDRVYIPGSPIVTLPELLREAEAQVGADTPRVNASHQKPTTGVALSRSLFETPVRGAMGAAPAPVVLGERAWTKEEWKMLDACFTDERLEVGGVGMAPVDFVRPERVVTRFVEMLGGEDVVETFGEAWTMENLVQRVKALQNKQRSGNVAPPTTPYTPSPNVPNTFANSRRVPSMEVPDFTPLGRRAPPPARAQRPVLPPPVLENAPFGNLPPQKEGGRPARRLPMSLLAPRYSHLLEEAVTVSQLSTEVADSSVADASTPAEDEAPTPEADDDEPNDPPAPPTPIPTLPPLPATLGRRVKGFLFSYLPTLSKTLPPASKKSSHQLPRQPGLPLPPLDVLEKPRGPIATPIRAPAPKPTHPKELVNLQPAPALPQRATMIPRARKPQRMVELQPVVPAPEEAVVVPVRPRRSSGGSVKDLVKSFEELDSRRAGEGRGEVKRMRSVGDWRKGAGLGLAGKAGSGRPGWKP